MVRERVRADQEPGIDQRAPAPSHRRASGENSEMSGRSPNTAARAASSPWARSPLPAEAASRSAGVARKLVMPHHRGDVRAAHARRQVRMRRGDHPRPVEDQRMLGQAAILPEDLAPHSAENRSAAHPSARNCRAGRSENGMSGAVIGIGPDMADIVMAKLRDGLAVIEAGPSRRGARRETSPASAPSGPSRPAPRDNPPDRADPGVSRPLEIEQLVHVDIEAPAVPPVGIGGIAADQVLVSGQRQRAAIHDRARLRGEPRQRVVGRSVVDEGEVLDAQAAIILEEGVDG